jgi:hypothetical protein
MTCRPDGFPMLRVEASQRIVAPREASGNGRQCCLAVSSPRTGPASHGAGRRNLAARTSAGLRRGAMLGQTSTPLTSSAVRPWAGADALHVPGKGEMAALAARHPQASPGASRGRTPAMSAVRIAAEGRSVLVSYRDTNMLCSRRANGAELSDLFRKLLPGLVLHSITRNGASAGGVDQPPNFFRRWRIFWQCANEQ